MTHLVYFISNHKQVDNSFYLSLQTLFSCCWLTPQQFISPNQFITEDPKDSYIVLIDDSLNIKHISWLQSHPFIINSYATILYYKNMPELSEFTQWPNISGYFLRSWSDIHKYHLLNKIQQGESCLSRHIMKQLIQYWQQSQQTNRQNTLQLQSDLTRKEMAILKQLHIGMSNLDIADLFYVSEHTIKSHLYRIFKKIQVKNRRQAIHWAQLYLSSEQIE